MSENTATTEKQFGTDARPVMDAYNKAVEQAEAVYHTTVEAVDTKRNTAVNALYNLLGRGNQVIALVELVDAMYGETRGKQLDAAWEVKALVLKAAKAQRDEDLGDDPFTKFVVDHIAENYSKSYADALYEAMPVTFDSLKQLANDQNWCSDFEYIAERAVREGALPDDTVEIRRAVCWTQVPSGRDAKEGETWVRIATVPAYVRTVDRYGDEMPFGELHRYIKMNRYEKTADAPAEDTSA